MEEDIGTELVKRLKRDSASSGRTSERLEYWSSNPATLLTTSTVNEATFGTGHSIYRSTILPSIIEAETEVILVTCFWARSGTLNDLNDALRKLSAKALRRGQIIRVRICFSSASLLQKLTHTFSLAGQTYASSQWQRKLGLPAPEELRGLDLEVKSIFVLPFCVMHPKFIIIDRKSVLLPSCNVSWEDWFEGCISLSGPITSQFVNLWSSFWASRRDRERVFKARDGSETSDANLNIASVGQQHDVPSIFLPSSHHVNPRVALPWMQCPPAPPTPLNTYLLLLFERAETSIYMQTPNLTSPPVLSALLAALERGVKITIVTSERLMVLEQLVTTGTTTKRCVNRLIKGYQKRQQMPERAAWEDLESGLAVNGWGDLRIEYYCPRASSEQREIEPVQSHLKLTIFDDRVAVLGSGNMDRASWFTSQELGVAIMSRDWIHECKEGLSRAMSGRSKVRYDSALGG